MASTDALPLARKNVALRVTFPILDADGDLVTGAAALDSEISKDGGTFVDCTNEATEIATASGMYFLDLTSTEMNADTVAIIVKTTTVGAKTTALVIYPAEDPDIKVNVINWNGTAPNNLISARVDVSVGAMATDVITAASIAASAIGAAEIADGAIDAATFAAGAINAAAIAADAIGASQIAVDAIGSSELAASAVTEIQSGLATSAALATVQADTDDIQTRLPTVLVAGRIDASVGAMAANTVTAAAIATDAIDADALATSAVAEIAAGVAAPSAAAIATAVRQSVVEGALTLEEVLRIVLAATAGLSNQPVAGQRAYRDLANTKNRILATVSQGDRSAVTLDGSA